MNAPTVILTASLVGVLDLLAPFLAPSTREARRGAAAYRDGDWQKAAESFQRAVTTSPDGTGEFNLGAAAYRLGKNDEASQAFGRAGGYPEVPHGDAAYNLGDARYQSGDMNGALTAFRAALRDNPDDEDARVNYEIALKRLASNPPSPSREDQEKSESGNQGKDQQNGNQSASPDSSRDSGRPRPGEQGKGTEGQAETPPQSGDRQQAAGEPEKEGQASPGKEGDGQGERNAQFLTREEARRLLDAVTPEEQELLRARLKPGHRKKVEKDW